MTADTTRLIDDCAVHSVTPDFTSLRYTYGADRTAAEHYFKNAPHLYAGKNRLMNVATGLVSECMVWALGGIWYINHFDRQHPEWNKHRERACMDTATVFLDPHSRERQV